jgi:uncharacterized membrane-anchored protein
MKNYKWLFILLNLVLLLVYFNHSIVKKEEVLAEGKLMLLQLAPVDPRSLMQGDYMTLRYEIAQNFNPDSSSKRGFCVVKLDSSGVAKRLRLQENAAPINENESIIKYFAPEYSMNIGAESYFFQEGQSEKYSKAKYGAVKVDKEGNSLLVGLYDEFLKKIE